MKCFMFAYACAEAASEDIITVAVIEYAAAYRACQGHGRQAAWPVTSPPGGQVFVGKHWRPSHRGCLPRACYQRPL